MLKRIVPLVLALVLCAGLAQAKTKAPATQLPGDLTLAEAQKRRCSMRLWSKPKPRACP